MQSHKRKTYACLAVTYHLHFWQNDRDLLRAAAVTRGWNGYRNKSQQRKSTLEKKILPPLQQGFEPATFQSRVRRSNHWAIPAPCDVRVTVHRAPSCEVRITVHRAPSCDVRVTVHRAPSCDVRVAVHRAPSCDVKVTVHRALNCDVKVTVHRTLSCGIRVTVHRALNCDVRVTVHKAPSCTVRGTVHRAPSCDVMLGLQFTGPQAVTLGLHLTGPQAVTLGLQFTGPQAVTRDAWSRGKPVNSSFSDCHPMVAVSIFMQLRIMAVSIFMQHRMVAVSIVMQHRMVAISVFMQHGTWFCYIFCFCGVVFLEMLRALPVGSPYICTLPVLWLRVTPLLPHPLRGLGFNYLYSLLHCWLPSPSFLSSSLLSCCHCEASRTQKTWGAPVIVFYNGSSVIIILVLLLLLHLWSA